MSQADKRRWVLAALDEHEVRLLRYAVRLLGDHDLARDAVQHAFVKLCDQDPQQVGERPAAWLYRVCRNRALDHLRLRTRQTPLDPAIEGQGSVAASAASRLSGHEADPADVVQARDLAAQLRVLVAALPTSQREALDLWCDGFAYRQIAEVLERKEGYVRVLVHRALAQLREHPRVRAWLQEDTTGRPQPRAALPSVT